MKRLILWTLVLIVGAGLGVGGYYVVTHWDKVNPFHVPVGHTPPEILTQLRQACVNDKELRGSSVRTIEVTGGKLVLRGWVATSEQKKLLEERAEALLAESPRLQKDCPDGVATFFTPFPIDQLLLQAQHDFDEGKGAEGEKDALRRAVMRTTRLDAAGFTDSAKLRVEAVCIRGSSKKEASADALRAALKERIAATGIAPDLVPEFELDVRYFTSPALLLQRQLDRIDGPRDALVTAAWYDGEGKLRIEGIVARKEQIELVNKLFEPIVKDPGHALIFRRAGSTQENLDIGMRLVPLDDADMVAKLQRRLVETARKEKKPLLRSIKLISISAQTLLNERAEPVTDDEGNRSHYFHVMGRSLLGNHRDKEKTEHELARWLVEQLPIVNNADQAPLPLHMDLKTRPAPAISLQQRLIERELDGAVITDALYDEEGKLELHGRLHQPGEASKQAVESALKDLLDEEKPWTSSPLLAHESRKDGTPIAWKDVHRAVQAKLSADDAGKRIRVDRLFFRYDSSLLRLVAEGATISPLPPGGGGAGGGGESPAKTLERVVDDVIASRSNADVSIREMKALKNPVPELQNLAAERPEFDGVILTHARYDADGILQFDGFLGQREQRNLIATLLSDRLPKMSDLVKKSDDPKVAAWSIDAMKPHASDRGESPWSDVVRAAQTALAKEPAARRASVQRLTFRYDETKPTPILVWKGTYLTLPNEKVDETALVQRVAETTKGQLGDATAFIVQPALAKAGTPIYELQERAVKAKLDGLLFRDAYYDAAGLLVLEGTRGSEEQAKDIETLLAPLLTESKPSFAPAGVAPFDRMSVIAWQPLLLDVRGQFAQGKAELRQTRIDRIYFQHDEESKKTIVRVEGIHIYAGTKVSKEEQTAAWHAVLTKQLEAKGIAGHALHLNIERKTNPAAELQMRAIELGLDGAYLGNFAFDAKGVCYVQLPFQLKGQDANIRKLLDEAETKHKHLGNIQVR